MATASSEPRISEADLQQRIIDLALLRGWHIAHFRAARTEKGWRTPVQGHKGFPDLVLARRGRIIFAELKAANGKMSAEQEEWGIQLGARFVLWRPNDWPSIQRILE